MRLLSENGGYDGLAAAIKEVEVLLSITYRYIGIAGHGLLYKSEVIFMVIISQQDRPDVCPRFSMISSLV